MKLLSALGFHICEVSFVFLSVDGDNMARITYHCLTTDPARAKCKAIKALTRNAIMIDGRYTITVQTLC